MSYLNNKPGSLEEIAAKMSKGIQDEDYQALFKKELEKAGKGIGSMTPAEKKAFFNKIDSMYKAKNESIEEKVDNPYAVGMAAAMKQTGDKPPLKKSTITKAHDIAKSIQKDEEPKADKMNKQQKDAGGEKKVVKEGGVSDYLIDLEDDAADMSLQDFLKKHKNGMASLPDLKQIWKRVNESVNEEEIEESKSLREGNINKVYVKKSGTDFDVYYRGRTKYGNNKMIGYFFKTGANRFSAYFDNENDDDDFLGSAEFNNKNDAIKTIFDYANGNGVIKEESEEKEEVKSLRDTIHDVWNQAANEEEKREEDAKWLKTEEKKSITEEKIKCPNCGHMNKMSAEKCVNCGASLTQKARPANNRREEKDSKKKAMTGSPASKVDTTPEVEFEK